jgi:hypothetical protein
MARAVQLLRNARFWLPRARRGGMKEAAAAAGALQKAHVSRFGPAPIICIFDAILMCLNHSAPAAFCHSIYSESSLCRRGECALRGFLHRTRAHHKTICCFIYSVAEILSTALSVCCAQCFCGKYTKRNEAAEIKFYMENCPIF